MPESKLTPVNNPRRIAAEIRDIQKLCDVAKTRAIRREYTERCDRMGFRPKTVPSAPLQLPEFQNMYCAKHTVALDDECEEATQKFVDEKFDENNCRAIPEYAIFEKAFGILN